MKETTKNHIIFLYFHLHEILRRGESLGEIDMPGAQWPSGFLRRQGKCSGINNSSEYKVTNYIALRGVHTEMIRYVPVSRKLAPKSQNQLAVPTIQVAKEAQDCGSVLSFLSSSIKDTKGLDTVPPSDTMT